MKPPMDADERRFVVGFVMLFNSYLRVSASIGGSSYFVAATKHFSIGLS